MARTLSREYLEEALNLAKRDLPGWAYAMLMAEARARSGGRSKHRTDEPGPLEKLALVEIKPAKLREIEDEDLRAIWLRLHQWYANAKKKKRAVENIVNAALWTEDEMRRRKFRTGDTELTREIDKLRAVAKARKKGVHGERGPLPKHVEKLFDQQPSEILLVRDFAMLAGSAAVTEKPDDLDVIIRAKYNPDSDAYLMDAPSLNVALRRFLDPDKSRGLHLVDAPQGSFTDYIPLYDLVARKREPSVQLVEPEPPKYDGKDRVIKQARAAPKARIEQAKRAEKNDKLTVGEFFFQPKPTRAAQPEELQTVDRLVQYYRERVDKWLPTFVQKKYDGVNHQAHKDGDKVVIYSEDGDDNTPRLPGIADAIRKLKPKSLVIPFELERWKDGQHLPREAVAGYLAEKDEAGDSDLIANIYDVLYLDGEDIHSQETWRRFERLPDLGIKQSTTDVPDLKQRLNLAPSTKLHEVDEIRKMVERYRRFPGSEGVVNKQADAPYPLKAETREGWVKYHNATTIRGVVYDKTRTKGGAWVYSWGVLAGKEKPEKTERVGDREIVPVGDTFATARAFDAGDSILIEAETLNVIRKPEGLEITAWVPRVIGPAEKKPDTVDTAASRAARNLVLQEKDVDEKGKVTYRKPKRIAKAEKIVPFVGPKNATVAFVGASPGKIEAARGEPFAGPAGETLNDVYLKPLGVDRSRVLLGNIVPKLLLNEDGTVRNPTVEEVKEHREWLSEQLDDKQPKIIVALGRIAQGALGDRADFVLPHPSAVRRFGDSKGNKRGFAQKFRRLKEKIRVAKQLPKPLIAPREEGGTRAEAAFGNWEKNWHEMLPTKQGGKFVYQRHWQGLSEEEKGLSDERLMETTHSIHGDLRLEADDAAWGFALFLGRTADNRGRKLNDKLIGWKPGDKIEMAPKLQQPKQWLDVGKRQPLISKPGEFGAATKTYSKFFALDSGAYELGVARQHMVEIFLDGKHLKGRYVLQFAPVAGRRRWLIDKPEDQTPLAERRDLADLISELRRKRQDFLIWAQPGIKPQKIDVKTGKVAKSFVVPIFKADEERQIVYGVVLDPYGKQGPETDAHNDWIPPAEVEKTAHEWFKASRGIGFGHPGLPGFKQAVNAQAVESHIVEYPSATDYEKARAGEPHRVFRRKYGADIVHSGAWILGTELGNAEWAAFKKGEVNAYSVEGLGTKEKGVSRSVMPKVTFVDVDVIK